MAILAQAEATTLEEEAVDMAGPTLTSRPAPVLPRGPPLVVPVEAELDIAARPSAHTRLGRDPGLPLDEAVVIDTPTSLVDEAAAVATTATAAATGLPARDVTTADHRQLFAQKVQDLQGVPDS